MQNIIKNLKIIKNKLPTHLKLTRCKKFMENMIII